ncbi:heme peroxidase [Polychytrium aggregatum]|uniref:heme peroxidase n=1 Tax=Polychytrium aggregatum TaxID=110093 RepID=UPI0022FEA4DB|nr:heme peroxidase [Polychytrium aggregatum]KAI9197323.1 heme peroxidase [Polychytrium aggregatum]
MKASWSLVGSTLLAASSVWADGSARIRSYSGSNNNPDSPALGTPGNPYLNVLPAQFLQGLPDPRLVSNGVQTGTQPKPTFFGYQDQEEPLSRAQVNLFETWFGQFINHDLEDDALTPGRPGLISVANISNDPLFKPSADNPWNPGHSTSLFSSSSVTRLVNGVPTPINNGNSFLDLSTIYGLDPATNTKLRVGTDGLLLTGNYTGDGGAYNPLVGNITTYNLAPSTAQTGLLTSSNGAITPPGLFPQDIQVGGDSRAVENVALALLHSFWIREHNSVAKAVKQVLNGRLVSASDETIFQIARAITISEYQYVIFNEYVPTIIGKPLPFYNGYNKSVDPTTSNLFAGAIYRYGHSTVRDYDIVDVCTHQPIYMFNATSTLPQIQKSFFGTKVNVTDGMIATRFPFGGQIVVLGSGRDVMTPAARYLALASGSSGDGFANIFSSLILSRQAETDTIIHNALRNSIALDLFSTDILRSRLDGLPSYTAVRARYGPSDLLTAPECVKSISSVACFQLITPSNPSLAQSLQSLYTNVTSIDALVGALAEERGPNTDLPLTIANYLAEEFVRKRDGDRFYTPIDQLLPTLADIISGEFGIADGAGIADEISSALDLYSTSMSNIIGRNLGLYGLPNNVFKVPKYASVVPFYSACPAN